MKNERMKDSDPEISLREVIEAISGLMDDIIDQRKCYIEVTMNEDDAAEIRRLDPRYVVKLDDIIRQ